MNYLVGYKELLLKPYGARKKVVFYVSFLFLTRIRDEKNVRIRDGKMFGSGSRIKHHRSATLDASKRGTLDVQWLLPVHYALQYPDLPQQE
jgi:hypothetical protein